MGAKVTITFPSKPTGVERFETEEDVKAFFAPFADYLGRGDVNWFNGSSEVLLEIREGEEVKAWAARMCDTLRAAGAPDGTSLAIFPENERDFLNGDWVRVDIFGPPGKDGPLMMRMRYDYDEPDGLIELGPA